MQETGSGDGVGTEIVVSSGEGEGAGERLDVVLAGRLTELSRSRIQALIKAGAITLNGEKTKPRAALSAGDRIFVTIPEAAPAEAQAEDIPLDILYEDGDMVVVNKGCGMVVHPAVGNLDGTLVNALLHHCGDLSGIGGVLRPGIVHRLDKETSGCLVVAKHDVAHQKLSDQFSGRTAKKTYLAVVEGRPAGGSGRIENRMGRHPVDRKRMSVLQGESAGKVAVTDWEILGGDGDSSLVLCRIHTGRTHQIRVHMKEVLRCPILGDVIYGKKTRQRVEVEVPRMMLHAWRLRLTHPISGEEMAFQAPVPDAFSPWEKWLPNG